MLQLARNQNKNVKHNSIKIIAIKENKCLCISIGNNKQIPQISNINQFSKQAPTMSRSFKSNLLSRDKIMSLPYEFVSMEQLASLNVLLANSKTPSQPNQLQRDLKVAQTTNQNCNCQMKQFCDGTMMINQKQQKNKGQKHLKNRFQSKSFSSSESQGIFSQNRQVIQQINKKVQLQPHIGQKLQDTLESNPDKNNTNNSKNKSNSNKIKAMQQGKNGIKNGESRHKNRSKFGSRRHCHAFTQPTLQQYVQQRIHDKLKRLNNNNQNRDENLQKYINITLSSNYANYMNKNKLQSRKDNLSIIGSKNKIQSRDKHHTQGLEQLDAKFSNQKVQGWITKDSTHHFYADNNGQVTKLNLSLYPLASISSLCSPSGNNNKSMLKTDRDIKIKNKAWISSKIQNKNFITEPDMSIKGDLPDNQIHQLIDYNKLANNKSTHEKKKQSRPDSQTKTCSKNGNKNNNQFATSQFLKELKLKYAKTIKEEKQKLKYSPDQEQNKRDIYIDDQDDQDHYVGNCWSKTEREEKFVKYSDKKAFNLKYIVPDAQKSFQQIRMPINSRNSNSKLEIQNLQQRVNHDRLEPRPQSKSKTRLQKLILKNQVTYEGLISPNNLKSTSIDKNNYSSRNFTIDPSDLPSISQKNKFNELIQKKKKKMSKRKKQQFLSPQNKNKQTVEGNRIEQSNFYYQNKALNSHKTSSLIKIKLKYLKSLKNAQNYGNFNTINAKNVQKAKMPFHKQGNKKRTSFKQDCNKNISQTYRTLEYENCQTFRTEPNQNDFRQESFHERGQGTKQFILTKKMIPQEKCKMDNIQSRDDWKKRMSIRGGGQDFEKLKKLLSKEENEAIVLLCDRQRISVNCSESKQKTNMDTI